MASRLLNRTHQVQWTDFRAQVPAGASLDAHIATKADLSYGFSSGSSGARLADNVTVTIQLLRNQSWAKKQLINSWPQPAQADLLRHEQGHYDITALMGRDMFIDLMALKTRTFSNVSALQTEVQAIAQRYAPQRIHTKYDSTPETDHGRKAAEQRQWDGYIRSSFTQPRSPAVHAPDGASYKITLLSVLRRAGKIT